MNWLHTLQQLPEINALTDLLYRLDNCFLSGFARLEQTHVETLDALERVFHATPLHASLQSSCTALKRSEFLEGHFAALAVARAALQGTLFDHLQHHARDVLGRPRLGIQEETLSAVTAPAAPMAAWLESTRHWLMEIALAGFARLDPETLTPFLSTLEHIQAEPQLMRQSALLTGFLDELLQSVPASETQSIPLTRWVDLWTRGMATALQILAEPAAENVSGSLTLLGCDLRAHPHLMSIVMYAILDSASQRRLVRSTFSSYKVDAINGSEVWLLFEQAALLFEALAKNTTVRINDMPLTPAGDLLWNGQAELARKCEPLEEARLAFAPEAEDPVASCAVAPVDRHPAQLAEPVFLEEYIVQGENDRLFLDWGDQGRLPVVTERIHPLAELTSELIAKSSQMFGLLRFDAGQWGIQPIGVTCQTGKGKKAKTEIVLTGQTAAAVLKKPPKTSTVAILRERASRLLRG